MRLGTHRTFCSSSSCSSFSLLFLVAMGSSPPAHSFCFSGRKVLIRLERGKGGREGEREKQRKEGGGGGGGKNKKRRF